MNSTKLNNWLQVAGQLGVIASLIFVGLQLKQTQAIALSDTYQNRTATMIAANSGAINSPAYLSGAAKIYAGKADELTMPEAIALELQFGNVLAMIENNHLQYEAGFLPAEHWQRNLDELRCNLTVPLFREVTAFSALRESFHAVIEDVIRQLPEDAGNCWLADWTYPLK